MLCEKCDEFRFPLAHPEGPKASVSQRTTRVSGSANVPTVGDCVRNDEASGSNAVANEPTDVQPPVAGEGVSMISGADTAADCAVICSQKKTKSHASSTEGAADTRPHRGSSSLHISRITEVIPVSRSSAGNKQFLLCS